MCRFFESVFYDSGEQQSRGNFTAIGPLDAQSIQQRRYQRDYPLEWAAWLKLQTLLTIQFADEYDFPSFLAEVGPSPTRNHRIERKDDELYFQRGNLRWATNAEIESPYLTLEEAAAYCRRKPKTLSNNLSLGKLRSTPQTSPPLFRREDLDRWLNRRRNH